MRTSAPATHTILARIALVVIGVIAGIVLLTGCGDDPTTRIADTLEQEQPVSLEGTWVSEGDLKFEADISPVGIEIYWQADSSTSGLYWKGTFSEAVDGETVVSQADKAALESSIFGSSESSKEFTYEDDELSFDFEAMGLKHTITLERK